MPDNKMCSRGIANNTKETIAVDCNRILDSCRDKDCFENTRVYLTECGRDVIENTSTVRVKATKIINSCINVEPVQFNRGFYQVYIRFYTRLCCEGCVAPGRSREFEGIAVCEKRVILYGGEGEISIFRSDPNDNSFCCAPDFGKVIETNAPTAVCEVVDPIALACCVAEERRPCCCRIGDIPENVLRAVNGDLVDDEDDNVRLYVTLGFFSVIRIERPTQILVSAAEYAVPEKQCADGNDEDPCSMFGRMRFPVQKFSPGSICDAFED